MNVLSQPIRFRNLGDKFLIHYFMMNSCIFLLKFEFGIPYAAFVQNSSDVSGENVGTICYVKYEKNKNEKTL